MQPLAAMLQAMWSLSLLGKRGFPITYGRDVRHHDWGLLGRCAPVFVELASGRSFRYGPGSALKTK